MYLEWGRAYYHFCRSNEALRLPGQRPHRYRSRTPAMAAGLGPATLARRRVAPHAVSVCLTGF
jgi:hypothetical protein